jgi:hypothetical protein
MRHNYLPLLILVGCTTAPLGAEMPPPFASRVVSFKAGPGGTFGKDKMPDIVLGPPVGAGSDGGSMDVVSLGYKGEIILAFDGMRIVDGPGPDLIVFENAFPGWQETGVVAVSADGVTWHEWPCAWQDAKGNFPGCAGVRAVLSNPDNGVDPTDPDRAGGDAFDLADVTVTTARFVRIRDSGHNPTDPPGAGFDLDAVSVIHAVAAPD